MKSISMLYDKRNVYVRAPLRVSFCGGGTDFPAYYNNHKGHVVSTTIDSYVYVTLKDMFDTNVRVHHEKIETESIASRISSSYPQVALEHFGLFKGIEVIITSDVMRTGSGLGASASLMSALITACAEFRDEGDYQKEELAELSYELERSAGTVCGKQDQYAAAFGGVNSISFNREGVKVKPLKLSGEKMMELENRMILVYSNLSRKSSEIQEDAFEKPNQSQKEKYLSDLYDLSLKFKKELVSSDTDFDRLGKLIDANWRLKKEVSPMSTNQYIDELYNHLIKSGLIGGKVAGAGGGGFVIGLTSGKEATEAIARSLYPNYICVNPKITKRGAEVLWKNF